MNVFIQTNLLEYNSYKKSQNFINTLKYAHFILKIIITSSTSMKIMLFLFILNFFTIIILDNEILSIL